MIDTDYKFWLIEYDMYSEYYSNKKLCKRVITKCEPICLYEILKFKEIQTFDLYTIYIDDYCSYRYFTQK